jgi:HK97 gp10 family phage protein
MNIIKATLRKSSLVAYQKNLSTLIERVERQGKREALMKAQRVMIASVKKYTPKDKRNLTKAIRGRVRTYKKDKLIISFIGPDRNYKVSVKGRLVQPIMYSVPQEFGSVSFKGTPFMRPGFTNGKNKAFEVYHKEIAASIKRAGARLSKYTKL